MSDIAGDEIAPVPGRRRARNIGVLSVVLAGSALTLLAVAAADIQNRRPGSGRHWLTKSPWWWVAATIAAVALVVACIARRSAHRNGERRRLASWTSATFGLLVVFVLGAALWTTLISSTSITVEGRPLRRRVRGRRRDISPEPCRHTMTVRTNVLPPSDDLTDAERMTVFELWARACANEGAAVVAFRQLEAELEALDAPVHLRAGANLAAAQEVRHAAISRAVAEHVRAQPSGTLDFPHRYTAPPANPRTNLGRRYRLLRLALEAYADGCCNEGAEAIRLHMAAARSSAKLSPVLRRIAVDEGAHAELAWSTIRWAIDEGGPTIGWALTLMPLPRLHAHNLALGERRLDALTGWGWATDDERVVCASAARSAARSRLRRLRHLT